MVRRRRVIALTAVLVGWHLGPAASARAGETDGFIRSGAWELGLSAAVLAREGSVTTDLTVFANRFWVRRGVPLSAGVSAAYSRVGDLDRVDLEGRGGAYLRLTGSSAYVYAGLAGGLSQEWVGSFSQARYPVGADVGVKAFVSRRAALTVAYEFRRLLSDPVADFNEHRIVAGLSILFRNGRGDPR